MNCDFYKILSDPCSSALSGDEVHHAFQVSKKQLASEVKKQQDLSAFLENYLLQNL